MIWILYVRPQSRIIVLEWRVERSRPNEHFSSSQHRTMFIISTKLITIIFMAVILTRELHAYFILKPWRSLLSAFQVIQKKKKVFSKFWWYLGNYLYSAGLCPHAKSLIKALTIVVYPIFRNSKAERSWGFIHQDLMLYWHEKSVKETTVLQGEADVTSSAAWWWAAV